MAKVIHLNSDTYRAWRMNHYVLVDEDQNIMRPAKRGEVEAYGDAQKHHRTLYVKVEGKVCSFVQSRELQKRAWFEQYGDCIIKASNGRFLCTARDPKVARPTYQQTATGRSAPAPHECECRNWGEPHEGRHHPHCSWNRFASKPEKADPKKKLTEAVVVLKAEDVPEVAEPETAGGVLPSNITSNAVRTVAPAPEACVCREWPRYDGPTRGHNKYCQYHEQWEAENPPSGEHVDSKGAEIIEEVSDVKKHDFSKDERATAPGRKTRSKPEPKPEEVPAPEDCICSTWERKDGSTEGHHSICKHHDAWELEQLNLTKHYVYEFVDREKPLELREATFEEIQEAAINEGGAGNSVIHIGEDRHPYLVATREAVGVLDVTNVDEEVTDELDEEALDQAIEAAEKEVKNETPERVDEPPSILEPVVEAEAVDAAER